MIPRGLCVHMAGQSCPVAGCSWDAGFRLPGGESTSAALRRAEQERDEALHELAHMQFARDMATIRLAHSRNQHDLARAELATATAELKQLRARSVEYVGALGELSCPDPAAHQPTEGDTDVTRMPDPAPGITARVTEVTVSAIPEGNVNHGVYAITVQWRGDDRYAVKRLGSVLGVDGAWTYEPSPSNRDDAWIEAHRFGYDEALKLAVEAAPHIVVNGFTVTDSLARTVRRGATDV